MKETIQKVCIGQECMCMQCVFVWIRVKKKKIFVFR